jgi:hypothetical protein
MEVAQVASIIQVRRDTAANWTSANPTLAQGELGVETDTLKVKCGNGSTAWTGLSYLIDTGDYITTTSTSTLTNKTIVDPIVTLNSSQGSSGQVLTSQGAGQAPTWTSTSAGLGAGAAIAFAIVFS